MPTISLKEFQYLCSIGQRYEGYVESLGYVFWLPKYVQLPVSDAPSQALYNTPRGSQFTTVIYELKVIKDEKNAETGIEALRSVRDVGIDVLSLYGIAKSIESMSKKPVILGPEYIQVNSQGTLRRNPMTKDRFTTKGNIARGVGNKIFYAGVIVDWSLVAVGEQSWQRATVNTAVNAGIWAIGYVCPPAAIVLGIAWFIISQDRPVVSPKPYEVVHGSITPPDKTRVATPEYYPPIRKQPVYYEQKQHYFNPSKKY